MTDSLSLLLGLLTVAASGEPSPGSVDKRIAVAATGPADLSADRSPAVADLPMDEWLGNFDDEDE